MLSTCEPMKNRLLAHLKTGLDVRTVYLCVVGNKRSLCSIIFKLFKRGKTFLLRGSFLRMLLRLQHSPTIITRSAAQWVEKSLQHLVIPISTGNT